MTVVNTNGIKMLLTNDSPVFSNGPRRLPRNPSDCIIFDSLILADKLFVKTLQRFAIFLLVNNNLCGN